MEGARLSGSGSIDPLRIAVVELSARFAEPDAAFADLERLLVGVDRAETPHLVLLPEASLGGYVSSEGDFDLRPFAEPLHGPTTDRVARLAARAGCCIAAPLIEEDDGRLFNAFVVVDPDARIVHHYRKHHPWYPETWATPGARAPSTFELHGRRLGLAICFDIQFVQLDSREMLEEADVLLFPSAWVDDGDDDLRAPLFETIASRFHLTVANANWGPGAPAVSGQGTSRVVSPHGEVARVASVKGVARRLDVTID